MHLSTFSTVGILLLLTTVHAAFKTSSWIDQLPAYSALAPSQKTAFLQLCARRPQDAATTGSSQSSVVSALISLHNCSHKSSILSIDVQYYCAASATTIPESLTAPLPEVTAALDVLDSYCVRSTELIWYQPSSTAQPTPFITTAPLSTCISTVSSPSLKDSISSKSVPVAAIAVPFAIGVLALLGVVCLLFILRRRKATARSAAQNPYAPPTYMPRGELGHTEVQEVKYPVQEVGGEGGKYRYKLETRPTELEG